jgi:1-acyl-sn-glycerol-3-phosphate acyltransferase
MRILIQIYGSVIVFFTMVFVLLPVTMILWPIRNVKQRVRLASPAWWLFSRSVFLATLSKIHHEDRRNNSAYSMPDGLYVINHQSLMDIPLALTQFAIPPIMKKEIQKIPIFGLIAKSCGAISVDRNDLRSRKNALRESIRRLSDGIGLQIYPEGTRSKTEFPKSVEEISIPLAKYCFENNIHVVPVSIYGTRYVFEKSGLVAPFKKLGIITHEEVYPKDFENKKEFSDFIWNKVIEGHKELHQKFES